MLGLRDLPPRLPQKRPKPNNKKNKRYLVPFGRGFAKNSRMSRKPLERNSSLPYHVTARGNNRESFPLSTEQLWDIIADECLFLCIVYGVQFQAVVLMPNHFHMILTIPEHDLGIVMNQFMKSVSQRTNLISRRTGHIFGGSYHWSVINNTRYFGHALKYVYRNPVRAQICKTVEEYPYSTLHSLLGHRHLAFPIHFTRVGMEISLPSSLSNDYLNWLNTPFPTEAESLIQKGLRKRLFGLIKDRKTRRYSEILHSLV